MYDDDEPINTLTRMQVPIAFQELYRPHRYKVYWGGRGGAKSTAFADALISQGMVRPLRILCTREKQNSIKESVHALIKNRIEFYKLEGWHITNQDIRHENGTRFFFMGLWNNIDSIKSVDGVDVCWVEEANTVSDQSWQKLIPTIRKGGSEIWASFNPELKSDAVYQRFVLHPPKEAVVVKVSWRDNPWFGQELMAELEHLKHLDEELYRHVWEGELKTYADGAIYAPQMRMARKQNRICAVPYQPSIEVHTFWDLGRNDSTAIWFMQEAGREHHFIDYYEASGTDLDHYARILKDKGYNYGRHYLPHDVVVTELSSNRGSRKEILELAGVKPIKVVPRVKSVNDGIESTRKSFPICWFDQTRCERGLDALANYQYKFNEETNTNSLTPLHNWASNGSDAFRQYAQGYRTRAEVDFKDFQLNQRNFE
jgi:phage terminase large subunit